MGAVVMGWRSVCVCDGMKSGCCLCCCLGVFMKGWASGGVPVCNCGIQPSGCYTVEPGYKGHSWDPT